MTELWIERRHKCHERDCGREWPTFHTEPDRHCIFCGSSMVTFAVAPEPESEAA